MSEYEEGDMQVLVSLQDPPPGVLQCLGVTLLLLGVSQDKLQTWQTASSLVKKRGVDTIVQSMTELDLENLEPVVIDQAKKLLGSIKAEALEFGCREAWTLYLWATKLLA